MNNSGPLKLRVTSKWSNAWFI